VHWRLSLPRPFDIIWRTRVAPMPPLQPMEFSANILRYCEIKFATAKHQNDVIERSTWDEPTGECSLCTANPFGGSLINKAAAAITG
jgi:hypothetical protein